MPVGFENEPHVNANAAATQKESGSVSASKGCKSASCDAPAAPKRKDLARAFSEDGAHKTHIGGQALIEGVMMRGTLNWAVAVRQPDGIIHSEQHELSKKGSRPKWTAWPLVRGCVALVDSLVLGFKALEIAANHAFDDEDQPKEVDPRSEDGLDGSVGLSGDAASDALDGSTEDSPAATPSQGRGDSPAEAAASDSLSAGTGLEAASDAEAEKEPFFSRAEMTLSIVLGCVLGVGLFVFFPALVSNVLVGDYDTNPLAWNVIDGIARVAIFVFYVWFIGRMKDIKRMFAYHGAEHKTIHCFEHGLELTPENARQFPCLHVRCGTAFLIMVMIIAILVYTIVPLDILIASWGVSDSILKFALVVVVRLLLMPVIAGISYEITVKWAGSHPENLLVKVVLWPGMQMQRLTTKEPDDSQLECAIVSMKLVLEREEAERAEIAAK